MQFGQEIDISKSFCFNHLRMNWRIRMKKWKQDGAKNAGAGAEAVG
jgi:hypothetical protein